MAITIFSKRIEDTGKVTLEWVVGDLSFLFDDLLESKESVNPLEIWVRLGVVSRDAVESRLQRLLEGRVSIDELVLQPSGYRKMLLLRVYGFPMRSAQSERVTRIAGAIVDLTERTQRSTGDGVAVDSELERIRELKCLYDTTQEIWVKRQPLDDALAKLPDHVRMALQFPQDATVEIAVHDKVWVSSNLPGASAPADIISDKAVSDIVVSSADNTEVRIGSISVFYAVAEQISPRTILSEERDLIAELAIRVGVRAQMEHAFEEVRKSRELYRATVDLQAELILRIGIKGRDIVFANRAFSAFFGLPIKSVIGCSCVDLVPQIPWRQLLSTAQNRGASRHLAAYTTDLWREDGKKRIINWNVIAVSPSGTGAEELQLVGHDITTQVLSERALNAAWLREREKEAEIRQLQHESISWLLATGFAHKINQPLGTISTLLGTCLATLDEHGAKHQNLRRALNKAVSQVGVAANITREFVEGASRKRHVEDSVDLSDSILATMEYLESTGVFEEIEVSLSLQQGVEIPNADPRELEQVFLALLGNAAEAARDSEPRKIAVRTYSTNDEVCVEIEDSGAGIDLNLIDEFRRPLVSTKTRNLGMGLPLCFSILERLAGRLIFRLIEGGGTNAKVTIPNTER